jgi:3,4-dihydroxy 2-butanone 4-phosphate synthase/GTP cyclohydrolase II
MADIIEYRLSREMLVHPVAEALVRPTLGGVTSELRAYRYTTDVEDTEYLALVLGDVGPDQPVLVRVQTANLLRDVFGAGANEGDYPATVPLRMIEEAGHGILLYVFPRGRAQVLDEGPAPADSRLRDFGLGAQVLAHLGARRIRLLTNHPRRIVGLGGYGIEVIECVPIRPGGRVMALHDEVPAGISGSKTGK